MTLPPDAHDVCILPQRPVLGAASVLDLVRYPQPPPCSCRRVTQAAWWPPVLVPLARHVAQILLSPAASARCCIHAYVYIHIYIHAYMHTCIRAYVHTCVCLCVCVCVCVCVCLCVCVYMYIYMYIYICIYVYMYIYTYIHIYIYIYIYE